MYDPRPLAVLVLLSALLEEIDAVPLVYDPGFDELVEAVDFDVDAGLTVVVNLEDESSAVREVRVYRDVVLELVVAFAVPLL